MKKMFPGPSLYAPHVMFDTKDMGHHMASCGPPISGTYQDDTQVHSSLVFFVFFLKVYQ